MLPLVQSTDMLGLGFLLVALAGACVAGAGRGKRLADDTREDLAGGALLVAILGFAFVIAE